MDETIRTAAISPLRQRLIDDLSPVRNKRWVVYAKPPFAGPEAVLANLSRYTHRVAISNRRLLAFDDTGVTEADWPLWSNEQQ